MAIHSQQVIGGLFSPWDRAIKDNLIFGDDGKVYHDLQAAVDNADSFVRLGPGDFTGVNVTVEKSLTIEGSGRATHLQNDAGSIAVLSIQNPGVLVQNLSVSATGVGSSCITFSSSGSGSRRGIAQRVWLREGTAGVVIQDDDSIVVNCIAEGVFSSQVFSATGGSTDCAWLGNYIMSGSNRGFDIGGGEQRIIANQVDTPDAQGIILDCDNALCNDNLILGGTTGIQDDGTNNSVHDNRIDGATTGVDNTGATTPDHKDNYVT